MAVSHGMDIGEVRQLGGSLQASAGSIDDLIRRIDSAVSGSAWVGSDATTFKGTWWPEHRARLVAMSEKLYGLGQSAKNNAEEQERVSGTSSGQGSVPIPSENRSPASYSEDDLVDNRQAALAWADQNPSEVAELIRNNLAGEPPKELLYFDPDRGMIAWVTGDLATADEVLFVVPGTGVDMAKASGSFASEGEGYILGRPNVAVVSALTWNPPETVPENSDAFADEARSMIDGPTADLIVSLGEQGKQITLVGHSAGATAVQQLLIDVPSVREHVDALALLAAPDLDGQIADAMGTKPVFVGYNLQDDMLGFATGRGQLDNISGQTLRFEVADLSVKDWALETYSPVHHPAHAHSAYVANFADDIDAMLPSPHSDGSW